MNDISVLEVLRPSRTDKLIHITAGLESHRKKYLQDMQNMVKMDSQEHFESYTSALGYYDQALVDFMEGTVDADTFSGFLLEMATAASRVADLRTGLRQMQYAYRVTKDVQLQYNALYEYLCIVSCVRYGDAAEHVAFLGPALSLLFRQLEGPDFLKKFISLYKDSTSEVADILVQIYKREMNIRRDTFLAQQVIQSLENERYVLQAERLLG